MKVCNSIKILTANWGFQRRKGKSLCENFAYFLLAKIVVFLQNFTSVSVFLEKNQKFRKKCIMFAKVHQKRQNFMLQNYSPNAKFSRKYFSRKSLQNTNENFRIFRFVCELFRSLKTPKPRLANGGINFKSC